MASYWGYICSDSCKRTKQIKKKKEKMNVNIGQAFAHWCQSKGAQKLCRSCLFSSSGQVSFVC